MRLATTLFYYISPRNIPYRFRGYLKVIFDIMPYRKNRIERTPTLKNIIEFKRDLEREEQNMLLLRHPYLTSEQSCGHMKELKEEKFLKVKQQWYEERNLRFNKRITIADRLNHLIVQEVWD